MRKLDLKDSIKAIIIILIIGYTLLGMVKPDLVSYKYSLKDIALKQETVDSTARQILDEEQRIKSKEIELEQISEQLKMYREEYDKSQELISAIDLRLHIPSILIKLEESAIKNNLELLIRYDEIKKQGSGMYDSSLDYQESETDGISVESDGMGSGVHEEVQIPNIEGVGVLTIPIEVKGDYFGLREFIRYIDTIDYIEPYSVDVESLGEYLEGEILLQVYHEEGN